MVGQMKSYIQHNLKMDNWKQDMSGLNLEEHIELIVWVKAHMGQQLFEKLYHKDHDQLMTSLLEEIRMFVRLMNQNMKTGHKQVFLSQWHR